MGRKAVLEHLLSVPLPIFNPQTYTAGMYEIEMVLLNAISHQSASKSPSSGQFRPKTPSPPPGKSKNPLRPPRKLTEGNVQSSSKSSTSNITFVYVHVGWIGARSTPMTSLRGWSSPKSNAQIPVPVPQSSTCFGSESRGRGAMQRAPERRESWR